MGRDTGIATWLVGSSALHGLLYSDDMHLIHTPWHSFKLFTYPSITPSQRPRRLRIVHRAPPPSQLPPGRAADPSCIPRYPHACHVTVAPIGSRFPIRNGSPAASTSQCSPWLPGLAARRPGRGGALKASRPVAGVELGHGHPPEISPFGGRRLDGRAARRGSLLCATPLPQDTSRGRRGHAPSRGSGASTPLQWRRLPPNDSEYRVVGLL